MNEHRIVTEYGTGRRNPSSIVASLARIFFWVLLFWAPTTYSIDGSQPVEPASTPADSSALIAFFREPFQNPSGYSLFSANTREWIYERFGKPTNEMSKQYAARTSNELVWRTSLEYSGITLVVSESEDRTKTWLQSVDIRSAEHILAYGLRVGSTRKDIDLAFPNIHFIEYDGSIRFGAEIYDSIGDVAVGTAMELRFDIGKDDKITRIMIESIDL